MKKLIFAVCVLAVVVGSVFAAQDTITSQDATKTGLEGFRTKVNANFGRIPATIATNVTITAAAPVTNVTGLASFATNAVLTLQYGDVVYGDVTNSLLTNVTITVQSATAPAVQTGAAPTITVQTKTP